MKSEALTTFGQFVGMLGLALLMVALLLGALFGGARVIELVVSMRPLSTKEARGFSEEKFSLVTTGLAASRVRTSLGEPFRVDRMKHGAEQWWYTAPKEPIEEWGTWDARYLTVSNGMVTEVFRHKIMNN